MHHTAQTRWHFVSQNCALAECVIAYYPLVVLLMAGEERWLIATVEEEQG